MKKLKCPECKQPKEVNEDNWYRREGSKSGFNLSKCRNCLRKYQKQRLHRVIKKPYVEPPVTPFDQACMLDRAKRAREPVGSQFEDVLK